MCPLRLQCDTLAKAEGDGLVADEDLVLDHDSASLDAPLDISTISNGSAGVAVALECVRSARECGLFVPAADLLCILKAAHACKDGPVRPSATLETSLYLTVARFARPPEQPLGFQDCLLWARRHR